MKMNDAVLLAALRVPYEMVLESELGSKIFYSQAQVAADKIAADALRIAELEAALVQASVPAAVTSITPVAESAPVAASIEERKPQAELSDQQILDIAFNGRILIRDSQIALRFSRAILEAARIERLSDEKIVNIARATKTPMHTGKGALRFTRILLAESQQAS